MGTRCMQVEFYPKVVMQTRALDLAGKVLLVGIGPGNIDLLTFKAWKDLQDAEVLIAHDDYFDQIDAFTFGKKVLGMKMTPVERVQLAMQEASKGKIVVIASSGDPGLYSLAGILLEHAAKVGQEISVEIVPGVTAMLSAAAKLGAPLGQDFAVVSVGERNTPWTVIRNRLVKASEANMVLVIYNPLGKVKGRLEKAARLLVKLRGPETPVGIVKSSSLPNERAWIIPLKRLERFKLLPLSIIIVGNSDTVVEEGRLITPRLYRKGY